MHVLTVNVRTLLIEMCYKQMPVAGSGGLIDADDFASLAAAFSDEQVRCYVQ
jgi:predicted secreted protein